MNESTCEWIEDKSEVYNRFKDFFENDDYVKPSCGGFTAKIISVEIAVNNAAARSLLEFEGHARICKVKILASDQPSQDDLKKILSEICFRIESYEADIVVDDIGCPQLPNDALATKPTCD